MESLWPVAATSLCFAVAAGVYRFIRPRFPVEVNCHFCNTTTKVPFGNQNCWDCPTCDQYNGFTEDGDYNKPIPSQHIEDLNHPITAENKRADPDLDISANSLCENCNRNQSIKIRQLANFVPERDDSYDEEIDSYKRYLDRLYCLCQTCEYKLQGELQKQDVILSKKLDRYFKEIRRKDDSQTEVSSTTFQEDLKPQIFKSRWKTFLQVVALFYIILLTMNTTLKLVQHSPAFEATPKYLEVFAMSSQMIFTVALLGGMTQSFNILFAGRSRLRRRDIVSIIIWILVILFHSSFTTKAQDKTDFYLTQLLVDLTCAVVSFFILLLPHKDPTSPRKVMRPYKLNSSRSSRLSLSFNDDDNIPDDIEPRQPSPKSTANRQHAVDNFAALETMSIGSPRKTSPRYLRAFGAFGDTTKFSPLPNHPPSPAVGLHHRRHNRVLLSPARFAPSPSAPIRTSSTPSGQNRSEKAPLFSQHKPSNHLFGQTSSGPTWRSLGSLSTQQAQPIFGQPGNSIIDPDRASLFSEPRIRNDNNSDKTSSAHQSSNSASVPCPVDSTIPDQLVNGQGDANYGQSNKKAKRLKVPSIVKTLFIATFAAAISGSALLAVIHYDVFSEVINMYNSVVLSS